MNELDHDVAIMILIDVETALIRSVKLNYWREYACISHIMPINDKRIAEDGD